MSEQNSSSPASQVSELLETISPAPRVDILMALGNEEACVCHLEAALGLRQAYLSQHLMALREAGILTARRDGRYIFYRLSDPRLLDLIGMAARLTGISSQHFAEAAGRLSQMVCDCPKCQTKRPADEKRESNLNQLLNIP